METKAELIRENKFLSARNDYGLNARKGYPRIMDETDRQICNAFEAGKNWVDEKPKPNLVDIDKAVEWLKGHAYRYKEHSDTAYNDLDLVRDFKQAMMKE